MSLRTCRLGGKVRLTRDMEKMTCVSEGMGLFYTIFAIMDPEAAMKFTDREKIVLLLAPLAVVLKPSAVE